MMPDTTLRIDEIERRPILVAERAPYDVVVVDGDRVVDTQVFNGPAHVHAAFFKRELRGVDADDHQSLIFVFLGPCANVGKRAQIARMQRKPSSKCQSALRSDLNA